MSSHHWLIFFQFLSWDKSIKIKLKLQLYNICTFIISLWCSESSWWGECRSLVPQARGQGLGWLSVWYRCFQIFLTPAQTERQFEVTLGERKQPRPLTNWGRLRGLLCGLWGLPMLVLKHLCTRRGPERELRRSLDGWLRVVCDRICDRDGYLLPVLE